MWACWLSGKPAVNLGSDNEARGAMEQFLAEGNPTKRPPHSSSSPKLPPSRPPPTTLGKAPGPSVWDSSERYVSPSTPPTHASEPARVLQERSAERHDLTIMGRIFTSRGSRDVTVLDLSATGCQFHDLGNQLAPDTRLTIKLGPIGPVESTVRWKRGDSVGVQFNTPLYPSVLDHIRDHFDLRRR